MAARTSSSLGVGIAVTILGILTLALFVTSIVFFSQKRSAERNLATAREGLSDFITDQERNSDAVRLLVNQGKQERPPKSAMGYLLARQGELMARVTGSARDTFADFDRKLKDIPDAQTSSLMALVRDRDAQIAALNQRVEDAVAQAQRAMTDRENEAKRVGDIEKAQAATLAALNAEIEQYKANVDDLRDQVNQARAGMDERVERISGESQTREQALAADLEKANQQLVLARSRIAELESQTKGQRFTGADEGTLIDGAVIGADALDQTVFISLGRRDRLTVGLPFAVYSPGVSLRPDENGNLPEPKGTIEVIRIDEDSAQARILSERRGNTILRGDVIVNPVYDPRKVYKFVVFGNFDSNQDGRYTQAEAADVRAKIAGWRGEVVEDIAGDVDFLVLGERPVLPPEPSRNSPIEVLQQYLRLKSVRDRYDELQQRAAQSAIPTLNLNRLNTLTGGNIR